MRINIVLCALAAFILPAIAIHSAQAQLSTPTCPGTPNALGQASAPITSLPYTMTFNDVCLLKVFNSASPGVVNIPAPGTGGNFGKNFPVSFWNEGAGTLTLTPLVSSSGTLPTINGAATITLAQGQGASLAIGSDGNWYANTSTSSSGGITAAFFNGTGTNPFRVNGTAIVDSSRNATFVNTNSQSYQINGALEHWGASWDSGGTPTAAGSGYAAGDTITLTGGTCASEPTLAVLTVSGGQITKYLVQTQGDCTIPPLGPVAQGSTSGSGTGATFTLQWTLPPRFMPNASDTSNTTNYGFGAGAALTTGNEFTGVGYLACNGVTTGNENTCLGWQAGGQSNGSFNVYIGGAGVLLTSASGSNNTLVGDTTARHSPNVNVSTLIGSGAASDTTGAIWQWTCVGQNSCQHNNNTNTSNAMTAIGYNAGRGSGSGTPSFRGITALGSNTGGAMTTASNDTIIGGGSSFVGNATLTNGTGDILIGSGNMTVDVVAGGTSGEINIENAILGYSSGNAPSIASGFAASGSTISTPGGTFHFSVTVGSTTPGSTGTLTMPTAPTGWDCTANDITTTSTSVFLTKQTGGSATTVVLTNYSNLSVATAWAGGDVINVKCMAY